MSKSQNAWQRRSAELGGLIFRVLVSRADRFGKYGPAGQVWTYPSEKEVAKKVDGPLTAARLAEHFGGGPWKTVGLLTLGTDSTGREAALDVDAHDGQPSDPDANRRFAEHVVRKCEAAGLAALAYGSDGRGGYHVRVAFSAPVPGWRLRLLARWLADGWERAGVASPPECFPKQDALGPGEVGNYLRLFGKHPKRDYWPSVLIGGEWLVDESAVEHVCRVLAAPSDPARIPDDVYRLGERMAFRFHVSGWKVLPRVAFNREMAGRVPAMLAGYGWGVHRTRTDGVVELTRPGKDDGVSGTLGHATDEETGAPLLFPFTTSSPLTPRKFACPFGIYAACEHGGDWRKAHEALAARGYGERAAASNAANRGGGPVGSVGSVGRVGSVGAARVKVLPPYRPFPDATLPPVIRDLVTAAARAIGCDPAFPAVHALAAAAAAIGSTHLVSPKKGWREPCCLFTLSNGRSGGKKSPPFRLVEDVVADIDDDFEADYDLAVARFQAELAAWEAARPEEGQERPPRPKPPARRRAAVQDVTIEALVGVLQENPRGVGMFRDELAGWVNSFVKYAGKSGATDLPHWLQLSNAGTVNYIRKTGDKREIRVRGACVTVTGTIQPRVLAKLMTPEMKESGLLYRLLIVMPPEEPRVWSDEEIPDGVVDAFRALLTRLHGLTFGVWPNGRPKPHLVTLTGPARGRFVEFYNRNGRRMHESDDDGAGALSKLEGYSIRFALLFHCCRHAASEIGPGAIPIGEQDVAAGVELAEWFAYELERVYQALGEREEDTEARRLHELVDRLAANPRRGGRVTARDLQHHNGKKYPSAEAAQAALDLLASSGQWRWESGPVRTRPGQTVRYLVRRSDTSDTCPPDGPDPASDTWSDTCGVTVDSLGKNAHVSEVSERRSGPDGRPELRFGRGQVSDACRQVSDRVPAAPSLNGHAHVIGGDDPGEASEWH